MSMPRLAQVTPPPRHNILDQECYFTASSPTPGTGLATIAAQASLAGTAPFLMIRPGAVKSVYLDYVRLIATAAGTAGTAIRFAVRNDATKAAPTGGSTLTSVNAFRGSAVASSALVYAGALAAAADGSPLLVCSGLVRPVIPVVGDSYYFAFGGNSAPPNSLAPAGTAIAERYFALPPVAVKPSNVFQFHIWLPSQSAASSYEVELGYWEF